jgi:hypothetical protein
MAASEKQRLSAAASTAALAIVLVDIMFPLLHLRFFEPSVPL